MYIFLILIDCRAGKVNFFAMKKSRVVFDILVLNLNLDMFFFIKALLRKLKLQYIKRGHRHVALKSVF